MQSQCEPDFTGLMTAQWHCTIMFMILEQALPEILVVLFDFHVALRSMWLTECWLVGCPSCHQSIKPSSATVKCCCSAVTMQAAPASLSCLNFRLQQLQLTSSFSRAGECVLQANSEPFSARFDSTLNLAYSYVKNALVASVLYAQCSVSCEQGATML